jgi:hypothetical protein
MIRHLRPALGLALVIAIGVGALADAEVIQKGDVRVVVSGELSPQRLPRHGAAPITASVGGQIEPLGDSSAPTLKTLRIDLNRNGRIDSKGLPVCSYGAIQPASTQRALQGCRSSLVGRGTFSAEIALPGQDPYPAKGTLLAFNGRRHGKPVLYGQIYSPRPFATSFVIVFAIKKAGGAFGTTLLASLPPALRSWGNLTGIELRLSRSYTSGGKHRSYISAGCPAPKGLSKVPFSFARTFFGFEGGPTLSTTLTRTCSARG